MEWTRDKPTVPGFYWLKRDDYEEFNRVILYEVAIAKVEQDFLKDRLIAYATYDSESDRVEYIDGYWFGPIAVPEFQVPA